MSKPRRPTERTPGSGYGEGPLAAEPFVRLTARARRGRAAAPASSYEERTGALIGRAALPDGIDPQRLERVWDRLKRQRRPRAVIRGAVPLRWAVAAVVLLAAGAVVAGTGAWSWPRTLVRRLISSADISQNKAGVVDHERRGRGDARALGVASAPDDVPGTVALAAPVTIAAPAALSRPRAATRQAAGEPHARPPLPQPAAAPRDAQLAEESQSLGRALVRLRQTRDPAGALEELDRYTARFPSGILEREALVARVDALLMGGHAADAQSILSRLTLGSKGRDRELRLIRAELATGSDCSAALDDYQAVWAERPEGTWGERALWGQAVCHARLGDEARAQGDLTRYLTRFPDGPHASDARARLRN